ncbi:hypothetical protein HYDPIDRAFT_113721, partial [Hydnomerulius pinastri MD-312]
MLAKSLFVAAVGLAASVSACSYSNRGDGFEMYVYGETSCGTGNHYEQFYGSGLNPDCDCYNFASAMNDNMKSFTFTASTYHLVKLFENADCGGSSLGSSVGNWMDTSVSASGQKTSSFQICYTGPL